MSFFQVIRDDQFYSWSKFYLEKRSKFFDFLTLTLTINVLLGTWKIKWLFILKYQTFQNCQSKSFGLWLKKISILWNFCLIWKTVSFLKKNFSFGVLNTLMPDEMRMLLADATKSRAPQNSEDHGDLIELNQEFAEKVDLLFSMKSKEKCLGYIDK